MWNSVESLLFCCCCQDLYFYFCVSICLSVHLDLHMGVVPTETKGSVGSTGATVTGSLHTVGTRTELGASAKAEHAPNSWVTSPEP